MSRKVDTNGIEATITLVDSSLKETKSHGTPGFPFAVYLDDFANFENGHICWHWHEEVQLTLIVEGEFIVQVENDNVSLKPGEFICINSGVLHQIKPVNPDTGKLYSFIWKGEMVSGGDKNDIHEEIVLPLLNSGRVWIPYKFDDPKTIPTAEKMRQVVKLYVEKQPLYKTYIRQIMTELWIEVMYRATQSANYNKKDNAEEQRVKLALTFIQEHYSEKITLEDIAREAAISKSELCRCFRNILGTSPKEYIIEYRIRQALILLKNEEYSIADVAEITGFNSPSHFGSFFLKITGYTPKAYKKLQ